MASLFNSVQKRADLPWNIIHDRLLAQYPALKALAPIVSRETVCYGSTPLNGQCGLRITWQNADGSSTTLSLTAEDVETLVGHDWIGLAKAKQQNAESFVQAISITKAGLTVAWHEETVLTPEGTNAN